jgi:general secretion pathway protein K
MIADEKRMKRDQGCGPFTCTPQDGVALLMVLWVLTILMVIVFSFSFMTRTETQSTVSFKEGIERKFLAEAGIERGILELFYRMMNKNQVLVLEGSEVWNIDGTPYSAQLGNGNYTVKVIDESGKLDINTVSDILLKNLLINFGIEEQDADIIVDSILDWRDPDDLHRLNGAEDDYYLSLPNPYEAKDGTFDTLEELLLVRGITPEILYGNRERKGIINFLTVHANSNRVNINAAPKEVLMTIPGMSSEFADSIIDIRSTKEILNVQELGITGENYAIVMPYVATAGSNAYTIEAVGSREKEEGVYAIRATVVISGHSKYTYVYYKSPADIERVGTDTLETESVEAENAI